MPVEADSYYDLNQHRNLIPARAGVDPSDATQQIADRAEELVIDYYTYTDAIGDRKVYLYEWEENGLDDNPNEQEKAFLRAYRREVAEQIWWELLKQDFNPAIKSRSVGKESVTYNKETLQRRYHPTFGDYLREFDARPLP